MPPFTYRSARSGSILGGIMAVLAVETIALHLWLATAHPVLAWTLTITSIGTMAWLVADYRAMGRGAVRVDEGTLALAIGRRATATVPLSEIAAVSQPSWRDVPEAGTPSAAAYLNLCKRRHRRMCC